MEVFKGFFYFFFNNNVEAEVTVVLLHCSILSCSGALSGGNNTLFVYRIVVPSLSIIADVVKMLVRSTNGRLRVVPQNHSCRVNTWKKQQPEPGEQMEVFSSDFYI